MLGKVAAGVGFLALSPIVFIAAAAGGVRPGSPATTVPATTVPVACAPQVANSSDSATAKGSSARSARVCQYGELEAIAVSHPRIGLRPEAKGDVAAGRIDPRVLQVLVVLAERHKLSWVGPFITGHSYFVRGTRTPSNHSFGRAVDIPVIDGMPVSVGNPAALDVMKMVLSLPPPLLPDELGGPWLLQHHSVAVFTRDHGDHIHIGWST